MKGVIFTEMVRFLEQSLGEIGADAVLVEADLPHGGAFTSVGTYPSSQALAIVAVAARHSGRDVSELCEEYGRYLFDRFGDLFPAIIERYATAEELLAHVGSHIHEEVRILYPDARPPKIVTTNDGADMVITYDSHRPFAMIAVGLVRRSLERDAEARNVVVEVAPCLTRATIRITAAQVAS